MNTLRIEVCSKTYIATKVSAYLWREILRIQEDQVELAKIKDEVTKHYNRLNEFSATHADGDRASELQRFSDKIQSITESSIRLQAQVLDRMAWVICETYNNAFAADDIIKDLSFEEIEKNIQKIASASMGIFEKN